MQANQPPHRARNAAAFSAVLLSLSCASPDNTPFSGTDPATTAATDGASLGGSSSTAPSSSNAQQGSGGFAPTTAATLTYYRDAAPVLNQYCGSCHSAGGLAPFPLDSFMGAFSVSAALSKAVSDEIMPPMPADSKCRPVDDPRVMPSDARQILINWVAQGAVEGDPKDAPPPPQPSPDLLGAPDQTFDSGLDYVSQYPGTDEYRCFLIDVPVAASADAVAFSVSSTNRAIVHHAFVELVKPTELEKVRQLDAADPQPGWECFGGPGFDAVRVGAYVPGALTRPFPNGTGVTIPAGSRFVVNIHYNFLANRNANRVGVQMWTAKQPLTGTPRGVRLGNATFVIPAGAKNVTATDESTIIGVGQPKGLVTALAGRAWGASGHMHLLGQSIRIDLIHADQTEECLLSIPSWDFHWQGDYRWKEPVTLVPGDKVRLTCAWDNSAEHQPVIDGVQQTPTTVRWGEKSTDEMCLGGLTVTD